MRVKKETKREKDGCFLEIGFDGGSSSMVLNLETLRETRAATLI